MSVSRHVPSSGGNADRLGEHPHSSAQESKVDPAIDTSTLHPLRQEVLQSAAVLQSLVPDAVLVGGSAAAIYARHRASFDHDHVVSDLQDRFEVVLDALEREDEWVTNRVRAGKIILGQIGDIEAGVRQLIRKRPLETTRVQLATGEEIAVPTRDETLRIKAFLIVKRNQVRDFLDVVALSDKYGIEHAASILMGIEDYYDEPGKPGSLRSQLIRQLSDPAPQDISVANQLAKYKGLDSRWHNWDEARHIAADLAQQMGRLL